uniref:Ubiquitin-like domain-containing protein n=1 Tax=Babesia bovis TaxID=5865 RepID=A7AUH2_BABBO|eukprot:XP_001610151.1 hypothetical protein [Babesia bovis T2Bo]
MQVLIKTLSGQRVPFDFEPGDTIAQVKRSIHENERMLLPSIHMITSASFDLRQMRLIYSGGYVIGIYIISRPSFERRVNTS